jgi:hypothetical protein
MKDIHEHLTPGADLSMKPIDADIYEEKKLPGISGAIGPFQVISRNRTSTSSIVSCAAFFSLITLEQLYTQFSYKRRNAELRGLPSLTQSERPLTLLVIEHDFAGCAAERSKFMMR